VTAVPVEGCGLNTLGRVRLKRLEFTAKPPVAPRVFFDRWRALLAQNKKYSRVDKTMIILAFVIDVIIENTYIIKGGTWTSG
jgi:hypothetical protein